MKSPTFAILASLCPTLLVGCMEDGTAPPRSEDLVYSKSDHGIGWAATNFGVIQDSRDKQMYRTVRIGSQNWFAENLNFQPPEADSSWCHASSSDTCAKYGRLYTWRTALNGASSSSASPSGIRGICPAGWHVPSIDEWDVLVKFIERDARVGLDSGGTALKASKGWIAGTADLGTDLFGFRGLPSGYRYGTGQLVFLGMNGGYWSTTEADSANTLRRDLGNNFNPVFFGDFDKRAGFSVRCLQD